MASLNTQVQALYGAGADAMQNMFDIAIIPPAGLAGVAAAISDPANSFSGDPAFLDSLLVRVEGFTPPNPKIKTYENSYKTVSVKMPSTKVDMERTFELSFRVDAFYRVYKFFNAWKSLVSNATTGYSTSALWGAGANDPATSGAPDVNNVFGYVYVRALNRPIYSADGAAIFTADGVTSGSFTDADGVDTWAFRNVWVEQVDPPSFKNGEDGKIMTKVTLNFGDWLDPVTFPLYGNSF